MGNKLVPVLVFWAKEKEDRRIKTKNKFFISVKSDVKIPLE